MEKVQRRAARSMSAKEALVHEERVQRPGLLRSEKGKQEKVCKI